MERERSMEAFEMSSVEQCVKEGGNQVPNEKDVYNEPNACDLLPLEDGFRGLESEQEYPSGISFVLLTIGLMAVVLVLALDNYIICESQALASSSSAIKANIQSDCHPDSHYPFQ